MMDEQLRTAKQHALKGHVHYKLLISFPSQLPLSRLRDVTFFLSLFSGDTIVP